MAHEGARPGRHSTRLGLGLISALLVALIGLSGSVAAAATGGPHASTGVGPLWLNLPENLAPSYRYGIAFAYDNTSHEAVLFGGAFTPSVGGDIPFGDTWTFKNGVWTNITAKLSVAPSARVGATLTYDAADGYLVLFGGLGGVNGQYVLSDTWKFQNNHWTNITAAHGPSARSDSGMTYDSATNEVLLFGGCLNTACSVGGHDLWSFHQGKWSKVVLTGSVPAGRADASFAFDPALNATVLFGGWTTAARYSDTWEFVNGAWTKVHGSVHPSPRLAATMAYDPAINALVLFGGKYLGHFYSDTWEFRAGAWTNVSSKLPGAPYDRGYEMMTYDPLMGMGSIVMFGGQTWFPGTLDDTWLFTTLGP